MNDLAIIKIVTVCLDCLGVIGIPAMFIVFLSCVYSNSKLLTKISLILLLSFIIASISIGIPFLYIEGKYGFFPYNGLFNPVFKLLGAKPK